MSKHEAVWEWLKTCPNISDTYFNFGEAGEGNTIIAPIKDTLVEEYIDGSALRSYEFAILRFATYSNEPNSVENITDLLDVEAVADWIEGQNELENYPDIGSVVEMSVLPDTGYIASVDEDTAKYMLQIQIDYISEK